MSGYPTRKQYMGAVQRQAASFRVGPLQNASFRTDLLGLPAVSSGQTAMVFRADVAGQDHAVRVFTSETPSGQRRYQALGDHLRQHRVDAVATSSWLTDGIEVDNETYPIVLMEWVDGDSLSAAIERTLTQPGRIAALAETWRAQMTELRNARFAHGDLQHGNVIVSPDATFRFIDLDGVWLPAVADLAPSEFGQPNYQHPDRTSGRVWGEHIDWFSALVIYTSLRALAANPALWRHHHGDNLILRDSDFRGGAPIWDDLAANPDPMVVELASLLAASCDSDPLAATDLEGILRARQAPAPASLQAPGPTDPAPQPEPQDARAWWQDHAAAEASPGTSASPDGDQPHNERQPASATKPGAPRQRATAPKSEVRSDWAQASQSSADTRPPPPNRLPTPPLPPGANGDDNRGSGDISLRIAGLTIIAAAAALEAGGRVAPAPLVLIVLAGIAMVIASFIPTSNP